MAATKTQTPSQLEALTSAFQMKSATSRGFSLDDLVGRVQKATNGAGTAAGIKRLIGRVRANLLANGLTITQKENGRYVVASVPTPTETAPVYENTEAISEN